MNAEVPVVAVDLGSTRLKAGVWRGGSTVEQQHSLPSPPLRGEGAIREGDAELFLDAATQALESAATGLPRPVPLGLATQRSSLVVWDAARGGAVTPVLSWQDRRAADWCDRQAALAPEIQRRTGLLLSPHYFAPKLAVLREADPALARGLDQGRLRAGTLDSFVLWRWSGGRLFATDPTMAARTLLVDLGGADWSSELLRHFAVPRSALPVLRPSCGVTSPVNESFVLRATMSDQAAGLIAALGGRGDEALVNLGTGGFVLLPVGREPVRRAGYLTGPYLTDSEHTRFALEGTINGIAPALDAWGSGPTPWPVSGPLPDAFCLPDSTGVGAPYWRPRQGLCFSEAARRLPDAGRRRVLLEGILFRVRQILDDVRGGRRVRRVYLSGGLVRESLLQHGLAALLDAEVWVLEESESTLMGVARLAAGSPLDVEPRARRVRASAAASYLPAVYAAWRGWMKTVLGNPPGGGDTP